eukprot:CAMPEP_0175082542 /NCGR_PEP_ID=MMETSP0052_2-20121109/26818_1 /TAXON_ID=51329 ORGANISM="Polytomella parva, Strain SAG 63-3" /NCGR_SAMPLE_ID=MMETSP0052_2 /ASSEMBLY_ACC=CAM_ASM_000194 /LENGTH=266 /DNA_ID=CAMNT_0016353759 /DNA_START=70 /DNA_END=870 /DNA_ORIENTATION=-
MSRGSAGYDRGITIFSPEGKLYQVEYAFKAVRSTGLTSIAVRGKDSVVFVTQKKVSDKLIDPSSITNIFKITKHIGALVTGLMRKLTFSIICAFSLKNIAFPSSADAKSIIQNARQQCADFRFKYGYEMPVDVLARFLADRAQLYTQHAYMRPLGVETMLIGIDEERGPQMFKVDPSGYFVGYKAIAVGPRETEANNLLEKKIKANSSMTFDTAVQTAIAALMNVLSEDLKATDIEVGVVHGDERAFRLLTTEEIDQALTIISERD